MSVMTDMTGGYHRVLLTHRESREPRSVREGAERHGPERGREGADGEVQGYERDVRLREQGDL
jgi:hypothetical protein